MLNTQVKSWSLLQHGVHLEIQEYLNHPLVECDLRMWSKDSSVVRALNLSKLDWKVAGSNSCRSGGKIFFSRVNFLCWLLFRYLCHPCVTAVAHKRPWSFCQKCRWQVTAKYTCTLHMWLCMKWHGVWLYSVHRTYWDGSSFMWHQPCHTVSTPPRWISQNAL